MMGMTVGVALAAVVSAGLAIWWYARREEKVRGRVGASLLRGTALFLALASPWLPPVLGTRRPDSMLALLVDRSASMRLPASDAGGESRWQRAADTTRSISAAGRAFSAWSFGERVEAFDPTAGDSALGAVSGGGVMAPGSRVVPAIEEARTAGADTVIVVTDGELEDREAARRLAERHGLVLREIRVAEPAARYAIRGVSMPDRVSTGDTVEVAVEVVAHERGVGPVAVSLAGSAFESVRVEIDAPTTGRAATARLRAPVASPPDTAEWRFADLRIEGVSEPWLEAATRRVWVEITPQPTGAVMVSVDPDWESRHLLPLLERAAPGGARSFLRMANGRFVSGGPLPASGITEATVRSAAERATLLVVQGSPADLPVWLARAMAARPAVLFLARGSGEVPGTSVEITDILPGEWYAAHPPPAGPVSAYVAGTDPADLPPLLRLHGSAGRPEWVALEAHRDRRGEVRPVATLGSAAGRRWAVVHAEGMWRWSARGSSGLQLYRGLFGGLGTWLVESTAPRPVRLDDGVLAQGDLLQWRVAPGVSDLALTVTGPDGSTLWSDTISSPPARLAGPVLPAGDATFSAAGSDLERPFTFTRPFHVGPTTELIPGPFGPPLNVDAPATEVASSPRGRGRPPIWPFAAATLLLCAEWMWRRRVGLR